MKLVWKFSLPQILIVICLGLVSFVVINTSFTSMRYRYVESTIEHHYQHTLTEIQKAARLSLIEASLIASQPQMLRAYELALSGDMDAADSPQYKAARQLLREEFLPILESYRGIIGEKLRLHFHLANGRSLVHLSSSKQTMVDGKLVDLSGDLSASSPIIIETNKSKQPTIGIEAGSGGFAIRGAVPVQAPDGRYLGAVEVLQYFDDAVVPVPGHERVSTTIYINKELIALSAELQDQERYPRKGDFLRIGKTVNSKADFFITPEFLAKGKLSMISEDHGKIVIVAHPFVDFKGQRLGVIVCAMNTETIANFARTAAITLALMLAGMIIMPALSLLWGGYTLVTKPLNMIRARIQDIAEDRADLSHPISVAQQDEIGGLVKSINVLTTKLAGVMDELRGADERMRKLLDVMPISVAVVARDGSLFYANQVAKDMFGLSNGQPYEFSQLSPEYQPNGRLSHEMAFAYIDKAFAEGRCHMEWMHQNMQGEPIPCEITLIHLKHRDSDGIAAYLVDLRERQAMLGQLREEAARFEEMAYWYESILDAIPVPVAVHGTDGRWVFVNIAFEKLTEKKRKDIIGLSCNTLGAGICGTENCALTCAKPETNQTYFSRGESSYQMDIAVLKSQHGEITGLIEIIHDITQVERLAKERAEATAANQAKTAFLAKISHEIRTPMNAILGITEIHLHGSKLPSYLKEAFDRIYIAGYTLLGIINDLLDLSKVECGKMELRPVTYQIVSLVSDAVQLNLMRINGKPIQFSVEMDETVPSELVGDDLRIRQILSNLLSNAFKYTQRGWVVLSVHTENNSDENLLTLVFRVSDTGPGMTGDQIEKVFDAYIRFEQEGNHAIEGIGLGMTITRQLVHIMDGEISVESEPGKGSIFTVRLPQGRTGASGIGREFAEYLRKSPGNMPHANTRQIKREPMPYGKVLLVDDVETNLYVGKGLMRPYGLSVETALSGAETIDKIRNGQEYDIVFLDHMMPKMDGVETVKALRAMGYTRTIIALTANAVIGQTEMFLQNGFDDSLSKPIDLRQLNMMLNKFIRDRQSPETLAAAQRLPSNIRSQESAESVDDPQLAKIFINDAQKALMTLEAMQSNQYRRYDDARVYTMAVETMKHALTDIGETELASCASRLEQAGHDGDRDVMASDTPAFLDGLRAVVEKTTTFIDDTQKALMTLEAMHTHQYRRHNDIRMYVITVHAMKGALANIGETELADFAHRLELAGRDGDTAVITADTPTFLNELRTVIKKITLIAEKGNEGSEMTSGAPEYLRKKLSVIENACAGYDKKTAKEALADLRKKAWPPETMKQLDAIALHLLHSDFEEAAKLAEETAGALR